jgi:subtilase family serine protease
MVIRHRDVGIRRPIRRNRIILRVEQLEARATPATLTPAQVSHAYGFDAVRFVVGNNTYRADGTGQTIAIVDAYRAPNIFSDVDVFDRTYRATNRSESSLYNQYGPANSFLTVATPQGTPSISSGWSQEIALDVEWAHAIAPGAKILLVEAKSSSMTDLLNAVDYARNYPGVSAVSMSWGSTEFSTETNSDGRFTTPAGHVGVTFVGASGDNGAPAIWPAVSQNVLAVGGTTLQTDGSGNVLGETAWSGSGGGTSRYVALPTYQTSVVGGSRRGAPDVSYNANPSTGFSVYVTGGINTGWYTIGGTSAGTPQWAALVAIANQGRTLFGKSGLSGPDTLAAIYSMSSSNFRDITSGSNGYAATAGYDLATGRGSPLAFPVIRDLVYYTATVSSIPISGGTTSGSTTTRTGISSGKGTDFGFKIAVSPVETAFASAGAVALFPSMVATAAAPTPLFVGQAGPVGQTFSTESTPSAAFLRPNADASWWRKPDTEADYNLRSADEPSSAAAAGDVVEIEPAEPEIDH